MTGDWVRFRGLTSSDLFLGAHGLVATVPTPEVYRGGIKPQSDLIRHTRPPALASSHHTSNRQPMVTMSAYCCAVC